MRHFVSPAWEKILHDNGVDDFDALWNRSFEPLDRPNRRGGKESFSLTGVLELNDPDGRPIKLFIKKQQNFLTRNLLHPIAGIPVAQRELKTILTYKEKGIPVVPPVLLSVRKQDGMVRAILLLEYLTDYVSLSSLLETRRSRNVPDRDTFSKIVKKTARVVRIVHQCRFRYGGMYPKHVFVRVGKGQLDVKLIDLEKSRYRPLGRARVVKDLEALYRHGGWMAGKTDMVRFLAAYLGRQSPGPEGRSLIRMVQARYKRKRAASQGL